MNPKFRGNSVISQDTVGFRMLIPVGRGPGLPGDDRRL